MEWYTTLVVYQVHSPAEGPSHSAYDIIFVLVSNIYSRAKTKVPPPENVRQPTFDAQGKCTNPLTVAEHAKHVENTRFIPFILESSGVYGKQASQFVQEVSKWAQSQGIRPDHFEENMRRCMGL